MLPLSGVKVVDMGQVFFGPGAAVYLADQGADVIKLEPLTGESNRFYKSTPYLNERGFGRPFLPLNRNKRSIALEFRSPEGQEIAHRLAKWADVFIMSFRPGTEARVRLDYETLAAINPRLIYAAISAFGREGPESGLPGYDIVLQSRGGMLAQQQDSNGKSMHYRVMLNDLSGCMALSYAITLALLEREKTGRGQRIDTSLLHIALALQMQTMVWVEADGVVPNDGFPNPVMDCYRCADEKQITIVIIPVHQWEALCRVLEVEHLRDDPRFAGGPERIKRYGELYDLLQAEFIKRPREYWLEHFKAAGVPCSAVADYEEVSRDPQVIANEMFWQQNHPTVGPVKMVSPPFELSNSRDEQRLRRPTPALGEHTYEVLSELGYGESAIALLYERDVVI